MKRIKYFIDIIQHQLISDNSKYKMVIDSLEWCYPNCSIYHITENKGPTVGNQTFRINYEDKWINGQTVAQ
jgi:hypothetical protein